MHRRTIQCGITMKLRGARMTMLEQTATLPAHPLERLVSVRDVARDENGVAHIVPVSAAL